MFELLADNGAWGPSNERRPRRPRLGGRAKPGGSLLRDSRLPKLKTNSCLHPMRHRWWASSP